MRQRRASPAAAALLLLLCCPHATAAEEAAAPAAAEAQPRFAVLEYRVLGNTTLPRQDIERAVYPFLGADKDFADVEAARQSLETVYRNAGYGTVLVDVPEQQVDEGIVRLRVIEGRLDRIRLTGARYFSNADVRDALPALRSGEVPALPAVQEQLAALNRQTRDRVITPVLKAGRTPGTVDVELKVQDALPLHGSVEVNDRYSADTSRLRTSVALSYDNLFQRQHSLSLQFQTAPEEPSDVRVLVASYSFRPRRLPDTTLLVYGVDSSTAVAALGTLSVLGDGQIFGARAIRSLAPRGPYSHSVTLGVDYKDFLEDIRLEATDPLLTPLRYLNWSLAYSGTHRDERQTTTAQLGANFGLRRLLNGAEEFADKRFKGAPNYFHLRGTLQQSWGLPRDLQFVARVSGQFTQDALVSNEQFGIGGAESVRGYLESSQLGDYGFSATLELRSSGISRLLGLPAGAAYLAAFYDAGVVSVIDPLPSQPASADLASWGLGMRVSGWHGLDLALDWARPFTSSGGVEAGDDRVHFLIRYGF